MSTVFNWTPVSSESRSPWRQVFNASEITMDVAARCPICGEPMLHMWLSLEGPPKNVESRGIQYIGYGRRWEWCSNCFNYAYLPDGLVSAAWKPPFDIPNADIGPTPDVIEQRRREYVAGQAST